MNINKKGYSIGELLTVIAIIVVLLGLASIPIIHYVRVSKQNRLDKMAQTVYVTAQNSITKLESAGRLEEVSYHESDTGMRLLATMPADYKYIDNAGNVVQDVPLSSGGSSVVKPIDEYYQENKLTVITSESSKSVLLVPVGSIDDNGGFVIEYDAKTGSIFAVFYYEKGTFPNGAADFYDGSTKGTTADVVNSKLRGDRNDRIKAGNNVGYYSGSVKQEAKDTDKITCDIVVTNKEILKVDFNVNMPTDLPEDHTGDKIKLTITVTGNTSGKTKVIEHTTGSTTDYDPDEFSFTNSTTVNEYTQVRVYSLLLDKLDEYSFSYEYGLLGFYPGEDLSIDVEVEDVTEGSESVASVKPTTEVVNSLFAELSFPSDESLGIADIAYVRHLQNLNDYDYANMGTKITNAQIIRGNQTRDLDFNNIKEEEYKDVYPTRTYVPIDNTSIYEYDGNGYYISNLNVNNTNAGLFGIFYGKDISNVIMVDAKVFGTNVGALAGKIINKISGEDYETITIDNCSSYLSSALYNNKQASEHKYVSGSNAGGLVGVIGDGTIKANLVITNSFASTTIRGTSNAGGLVGLAYNNIDATRCYADSYFSSIGTGKVGGLAGSCGNTSTFTGCYSAGFLMDMAGYVAGFVPNAIKSTTNSYTVFHTMDATIGSGYSVAQSITTVTKTYYASMSNLKNTTAAIEKTLEELTKIGPTLGDTYFNVNPMLNITTPYRMSIMAEALERYPYPTINFKGDISIHELSISMHYGDWYSSDKVSGNIAYYEIYTDGTAGFFTPGKSTLHATKEVAYDGYCIIYSKEDYESASQAHTVRFYGNGGDTPTITYTTKKSDIMEVRINGEVYYFVHFTNSIMRSSNKSGSFYQKITIDNNDVFYFNPGLAKTVVTVDSGKAPETIYIRTPRHTYYLSNYYDSSVPDIYNSVFYQEKNINYAKNYQWTNEHVGFASTISSQSSIGTKNNKFTGTYNGQNHTISGVSIYQNGFSETGFFGHTSKNAVIKNVYISNEYNVVTNAPARTLSLSTTSSNAYVGSLVAYNEGRIENCAADNFVAKVEATNSSELAVGELVGKNEGTITNSSADIPQINVTANSSTSYVGGFAGKNDSTITYSYAIGAVDVENNGSTVKAGGFTGSNHQTSYAYSATSIDTYGNDVDEYGFSPKNGVASYCFYLNSGYIKYAGNMYKLDYDSTISAGTSRKIKDFTSIVADVPGFNEVDFSYDHVIVGEDEEFPFTSTVTDGGQNYVQYGEWPTRAGIGEIGFFYWELEDGQIHYHMITSKHNEADSTINNLCNDYNCNHKITDYGYGYYIMTEYLKSPNYNNFFNNEYLATGNNTDICNMIVASLGIDVSDYTFFAYESGKDGLYATSFRNSRITFENIGDDEIGYKDYGYTFSPLFADSFTKDNNASTDVPDEVIVKETIAGTTYDIKKYTNALPLKIRSVEQLQYINWYYMSSSDMTASAIYSPKGSNVDPYRGEMTGFLYFSYPNYTYVDHTYIRNFSYTQTHNINASSYSGYVPISSRSAAPTGTPVSFIGTYDGQCYEINNLNITSNSTAVGIFGNVTDTTLKNIILYSSTNNGNITRTGSNPSEYGWDTENKGAYYIGGIVGFANDNSKISNCTVAGYTITDQTKKTSIDTETVSYMGGIVGAGKSAMTGGTSATDNQKNSYVIINNCSSYVDIISSSTSTSSGAIYDHIHIGGIAGGAVEVNNCYSGGSIKVADAALSDTTNKSYYYIGGIVGGIDFCHWAPAGYSLNSNITAKNCYSYMYVPTSDGNNHAIKASAVIGTSGEVEKKLTITNSYYFDKVTSSQDKNYIIGSARAGDSITVSSKTLDEMSDTSFISTMGGAFGKANATHPVTDEFRKKEYPFPAVIAKSGHSHYGNWPVTYKGLVASASEIDLDLFTYTDTKPDSSYDITIKYFDNAGNQESLPEDPSCISITYGDGTKTTSDLVEVSMTKKEGSSPVEYNFHIQTKNITGKETIYLTYGGTTITIDVNITGELTFEVVETVIGKDLYEKEITEGDGANIKHYTLTVKDAKGRSIENLTDDGWVVDVNDLSVIKKEGTIVEPTTTPGVYDLTIKGVEQTSSSTHVTRTTFFNIKNTEVPVNGASEDYKYASTKEIRVDETVYPVNANIKINYYDKTTPLHNEAVPMNTSTNLWKIPDDKLNGRKFIGWFDASGKEYTSPTQQLTKDLDLYAKFDYYVITLYDNTLDPENPTTLGYIYVSGGNYYKDSQMTLKITNVDLPTKAYFTYSKYASKDGSETFADKTTLIVKPGSEITSDLSYYVNWVSSTHNIVFYDGTTLLSTIQYEIGYNTLLGNVPDNPTPEDPEHETFVGWYIEESGTVTNKMLFNTEKAVQEVEGYYKDGKWVNRVTETDDGTIILRAKYVQKDSKVKVDDDTYYIKPGDEKLPEGYTPPTKEHEKLDGFGYYKEDGTYVPVINPDGTFVKDAKDKDGKPITDENGKWVYEDEDGVPKNIDLVSKWTKEDSKITLKPGEGSSSSEPIETWIDKDEKPTSTTVHDYKEGYRLSGYGYKKDDGTFVQVINPDGTFVKDVKDKDGNPITNASGEFIYQPKDLELISVWNEQNWKLSFNTDGGSTVDPQTVKEGTKWTKPADPTKDGYNFMGWFTDTNYNVEFDFTQKALADKTAYAKFVDNTGKTIVYHDKGGSSFSGTHDAGYPQAHYNGKATTFDNPSKVGYTFAGYYMNSACTGDPVTGIPASATYTSNIDVYAKWTAITYTVKYDANGGDESSVPASQQKTYDTNLTLSSTKPTRTNYHFLGWSTDKTATTATYPAGSTLNVDLSTTPGGTGTLYAIWAGDEYTITYYDKGGSSFSGTHETGYPTKHTYGQETTLDNPTKKFSTFNGYYLKEDCSGSPITSLSATGYTGDIKLYASWTSKKYNITLNKNSTGKNDTIYELYGSAYYSDKECTTAITKVTVPTLTGYTFCGYYDSPITGNKSTNPTASNQIIDKDGNIIASSSYFTSNTTINGMWKLNTYNLQYDLNGGTLAPQSPYEPTSVTYGTTFTVRTPSRTGYVFDGWTITGMDSTEHKIGTETKTDTSLSNVKVNNFSNLRATSGMVSFKAAWNPVEYTIAYDANGGSGAPGSQTKKYETNLVLSSTVPTRDGYTFLGWSKDQSATVATYQPGATLSTDFRSTAGTETLYAVWQTQEYSITYLDKNEDTKWSGLHETGYPTKHTYGTATTLKTASRTGYDFGGYFIKKDCTGTALTVLSATGYTAKITLYANWINKVYKITLPDGPTIYVKYDVGYFSDPDCNNPIEKIDVPTKEGYTFGGYYESVNTSDPTNPIGQNQIIDKDGNIKVPSNYFTDDKTVAPLWTPNKYSISYNYGTTDTITHSTKPTSAYFDQTITITNPSRTGYDFVGWTITGMDTTTHTIGSTTTKETSASNVTATTFKNLRATSGTVTFTANWLPRYYMSFYSSNMSTEPTIQSIRVNNGYKFNDIKTEFTNNVNVNVANKLGYTFSGWYYEKADGTYEQVIKATYDGSKWNYEFVSGTWITSDGKIQGLNDSNMNIKLSAGWSLNAAYVYANYIETGKKYIIADTINPSKSLYFIIPKNSELKDGYYRITRSKFANDLKPFSYNGKIYLSAVDGVGKTDIYHDFTWSCDDYKKGEGEGKGYRLYTNYPELNGYYLNTHKKSALGSRYATVSKDDKSQYWMYEERGTRLRVDVSVSKYYLDIDDKGVETFLQLEVVKNAYLYEYIENPGIYDYEKYPS